MLLFTTYKGSWKFMGNAYYEETRHGFQELSEYLTPFSHELSEAPLCYSLYVLP